MVMNQALFQEISPMLDGDCLEIPCDLRRETPLYFFHQMQQEGLSSFQNRWAIGQNSHLVVIQDYTGCNHAYERQVITDVAVSSGASLIYYCIQREGQAAVHHSELNVQLHSGSYFEAHILSVGAQSACSQLNIELLGERASCVLNGIYLPRHSQQMDHKVKVTHRGMASESTQDYKGILRDAAKASFNGIVYVENEAIQTVAKQNNKNLLLSSQAQVSTQPILNILVDDVLCSHGATIGQLEEDALFYFASRGIPVSAARQYLIEAFIDDNLGRLNAIPIKEWMKAELIAFLGA